MSTENTYIIHATMDGGPRTLLDTFPTREAATQYALDYALSPDHDKLYLTTPTGQTYLFDLDTAVVPGTDIWELT